MQTAPGKTDEQKRGAALNILRRYLDIPQKFRDITEIGKGKSTGKSKPEPPFPME